MLHGYGILNNHVPTLKATVMKIGAAISTLLTSLYAVYKGESNANDSLNTYNGTAQGGLTYTTGKSGNAFVFNGTSAYVKLPNNSFSSLTGDFSISFWIYPTFASSTTYRIINNNYYNGSVGWGFHFTLFSFGATAFLLQNGSSVGDFRTNNINIFTNNSWNHIVITRKSSTSTKIYKNGVDISSSFFYNFGNSSINPVNNTTQYCTIGAQSDDGTSYFGYLANGTKIDEVNVWSKELTSTEVTELYNAGTGKFYPY